MTPQEITQSVDHIAGELNRQLSAYGPKAWDMALLVERANCVGNLIIGAIGCIVLTGSAFFCFYWAKKAFTTETTDDDYSALIAVTVFGGLIAVTVDAIVFFTDMLNQWNWIGAFYPAVGVAHDILTKVGVMQ